MIVQCGRELKKEEIDLIKDTVGTFPKLSRSELAHTVCEHLGWYTASGGNKVDACLKLLQRLESQVSTVFKNDGKVGENRPEQRGKGKGAPLAFLGRDMTGAPATRTTNRQKR